MQQELFDVLAKARISKELRRLSQRHKGLAKQYLNELREVDMTDLAIHRMLSKVNYSRNVRTFAVQAHQKPGLSLTPDIEIGYVERDASRGKSILKRDTLAFDSGIMEATGKAWEDVVFVFLCNLHKLMTSGKNIFACKKMC